MSRITKIKGEFMGVGFEVKPTPLNIDEVEKELQDMIRGWYEENEPEFFEKLEAGESLGLPEDPTKKDIEIAEENLRAMKAWKRDVDFRSEYVKKMALACMELDKDISDDTWGRDDIEFGTVKEAFDFFCERRSMI